MLVNVNGMTTILCCGTYWGYTLHPKHLPRMGPLNRGYTSTEDTPNMFASNALVLHDIWKPI